MNESGIFDIMRCVIQCVNHASVEVNEQIVASIGSGYLIFFGACENDTEELLPKFVDKILKLRILPDENGKTNLSIKDVAGELLIVSQFTLYADCRKGNRPSFTKAGNPEHANALYENFVALCQEQLETVKTGIFGAHMKVQLENNGPFTIVLDSNDLIK